MDKKLYNNKSLKSLKEALEYHIEKLKAREEIKAYITQDLETQLIVKSILKSRTAADFFFMNKY